MLCLEGPQITLAYQDEVVEVSMLEVGFNSVGYRSHHENFHTEWQHVSKHILKL